MNARLAVALLGLGAAFAQADEAVKGEQVSLSCEAVYLPARSTWVREVRFTLDERRIRGVEIDGVPVYSFSVFDTVLLTALDNERIQLDTAALIWRSDFRGQATSEGRCTRR
ncbi:MAG TPA: hypothetical protein VLG41_01760 [Hydrogenophaga sp.]|uniref:hypothetical protein n=1 Tax=Hydrogenophaga sp. TaxID=1904254 RepID=UPI002B93E57A|nr:hypothetical protein [Hydrogenophaga sp.]HSX91618.1 hypothetical protein [Hydrogenophaga sp.]